MQITQSTPADGARLSAPVVFVATIFLSASLLFFVQPLFTRIVLPHIGGSPAIWTTAMLFFQTILIAGYLYAHLMTRHFPVRAQLVTHLAVWALALFFLPLAIPGGWQFDPDGPIAWQTLMLFGAGVGLPFFALSANAPLLQSWYGRSGGPSASDPYFLYGASNLGSLVALLGFPLVAEPLFGATKIGMGWAMGFGALGALLLLSGLAAKGPALTQEATPASTRPTTQNYAYWAFLAFVPSSLMLAVTSKISMDLGSVPMVWVIPLALYLLTFVLTFSNRRMLGIGTLKNLCGLAILGMLAVFFGGELNLLMAVALVIGFFVITLFAHRQLYLARPDAHHLTGFYLTMSVGGALGGLFNSILAPVFFAGLYEAGVTLVLAALMILDLRLTGAALARAVARGALLGALAAAPAFAIVALIASVGINMVLLYLLVAGLAAAVLLRRNTASLFSAVIVMILAGKVLMPDTKLFRDRSFFGAHSVYEAGDLRLYGNGTTIHGAQRITDDAAARPEPLFYYHPNGPMAQVLTSARGTRAQEIGIVGLGVGSLACYAKPGQNWQFYEIDRMVDDIARTPAFFRFMSACAGEAPTHLGDARVVLAEQTGLTYDILVIDAYSSDSVPVHLTTLEAVELYMNRLAEDGVLVFHISNRYYDIERPLARAAEALGLEIRMQEYGGNAQVDPGDSPSDVVIISRSADAFGDLGEDPRWTPLSSDGGALWTDDHANLLSILR